MGKSLEQMVLDRFVRPTAFFDNSSSSSAGQLSIPHMFSTGGFRKSEMNYTLNSL